MLGLKIINGQPQFTDEGNPIETASILSLFINGRDQENNTGGWFGDTLLEYKIGSLLWTIIRKKITSNEIMNYQYEIESALNWLIENKWVESINVSHEVKGNKVIFNIDADGAETNMIL